MVAPAVEQQIDEARLAEQVEQAERDRRLRETTVLAPVVTAEDGSATLPPETLATLGVGPGDELLVFEAAQGVVVTTKKRWVNWALDSIGAELRANGVTLEELMESGAEIRQQIYDERYGNRSDG